MNRKTTKIVSVLALAATALLVLSCHWTITKIKVSETIPANGSFDVDFVTNIQTPETDYSSNLVVMFLVPKSWNAQTTATVSFSTDGFVDAMVETNAKWSDLVEYDHEALVPVTDEDLCTMPDGATKYPFPTAFYTQYGNGGNYCDGELEWVGFKTADIKVVTDISANAVHNNFNITIHANFKTDDVNYKYYMNCWAGSGNANCGLGYPWGEGFGAYNTGIGTTLIEVTGGSENANFSVPKMVSTVPTEFRYGDIFNVVLTADLEGGESVLKDKEEVYLCGEAVLANGEIHTVDTPLEKNLMKRDGGQYSKYILPSLFFDIAYSEKIESMHVWFCDKTGEIIEKCGYDNGWEFTQAENE